MMFDGVELKNKTLCRVWTVSEPSAVSFIARNAKQYAADAKEERARERELCDRERERKFNYIWYVLCI